MILYYMQVVDMTGPEAKILTGYGSLSQQHAKPGEMLTSTTGLFLIWDCNYVPYQQQFFYSSCLGADHVTNSDHNGRANSRAKILLRNNNKSWAFFCEGALGK